MGLFGGSSKKQKVHVTAYYLSQHVGVSKALDWVSGIWYREKQIWAGEAAENTSVVLNNGSLFGGPKEEGGVGGTIDIMLGKSDQVPSSTFAAKMGRTVSTCPGFRGVTTLLFRSAVVGLGFYWQHNNAYLGNIWVKGTRAPKGLSPEIALIPRAGSVARTEIVDLHAVNDAAGSNAGGLATGVTLTGFTPGQILKLTLPEGETYTAYSVWGAPSPANAPGHTGSQNAFRVIPDGNTAATIQVKDLADTYDGYEAARAAFGTEYITGASEYTFFIFDSPTGDNSGGLSIKVEAFSDIDANPAHIIYECQTDTDFGMGAPSTLFDVDTYEAAAQTLYDEGLGLSLTWSRQTEIENFVQEIIDHIEAVLFINPRTGLWNLKLIRADYDEGTLRELTPDNCVVTKFQRKALGETINEIVPIYTDPETEEEVDAPPVHDQANITMQGGIVTSTRNYYGARTLGLARRLAYRDLRTAAEPLASADVEVDRSLWDVLPGECLKLTYPEYGIDTFIMRVGPVDYGKPGDSKIKITLVEDVFAKPSNDFEEVDYDEWEDPDQPPSPIDYVRIFTLPYSLVAPLTELDFDDAEYPEVLLGVLAAEDSVTNSYDLMLELPDSLGDPVYTNVGTKNLTGRGTLAAPLAAEASSTVTSFSGVISAPPQVGGLMFIGDAAEDEVEICLIEDFGGSPESWTVRRGVLDTVPRAWDAGTVVWFASLEAIIADETVLSSGQTINAKLLSNTALGQLAEADAPVETETLTDRPYQPIRPADVKVNGIGFGTVDAIGLDPIPVTWANRNRLTEPTPFSAWDDATVSPEAGQTTTIIVKDLDGVTLDTISGLSGTSHDVPASSFGSETSGVIEVWSERDGFLSLQAHAITVIVSAADVLQFENDATYEFENGNVRELETA